MFNLTETSLLPRPELLPLPHLRRFHTGSDVMHSQVRAGGWSFKRGIIISFMKIKRTDNNSLKKTSKLLYC